MPDVTMPQLGETVADGTVTKWFKKVGDTVVRGETLFEVSTDKVDTEIPAQANGVLSAILVAEGVTVDVGTILAVIGDGSPTKSAEPLAPATSSTKKVTPNDSNVIASNGDVKLSPVVRRLLDELGLSAEQVTGTGPNGRITRDDVTAAANLIATQPTGAVPLSPVVRKLLSSNGIDAARVVATGSNGRVTRRDAELAIAANGEATSPLAADERVPFSKIRRLTAEHMVRSKATSAHTLMVREIDYERVEKVRRLVGPAFKEKEGFSLTYLPFIAVAAVEALQSFPHLNSSVGNDELIVHHQINLGIAVDLDDEGLLVPVVHDARGYGVRTMATTIRELATRARNKKLGVDDMANGTFTITNPGPFGTLLTGAVINQPQVAILSTDGVTRKPVVVNDADGNESIAIHSIGLLALTFDHRAVDGAYAARYLRLVAEIINSRDWNAEFQG
jgi:pyruvate dehydrogenase E2 component (dihydrolipoamide acetyltransferase)